MQRRQFLVGALTAPAVMLLPGCSTGFAGRAQRFADEVLPGQLRLVDVITEPGGVVPVPTRTAVYQVIDDPDASVVLPQLDAEQLRAAYALSRPIAVELRLFAAELSTRGFPVQGFRVNPASTEIGYAVTLEADVSEATVASVQASLDTALAGWQRARAAQHGERVARITLGLIPPAAVPGLPALAADQPLTRRLDHKQRNDALFAGSSVFSDIRIRADGTLTPVADRMTPHPGLIAQLRVDALAEEAAGAWAAANAAGLRVEGEDPLVRRLRPGSVSDLRLYVRARRSDRTERGHTHLIAVDVDLDTATVGDLELLERPARG